MFVSMEPEAKNSIVKLGPNRWAVGSMMICERTELQQEQPRGSIATWFQENYEYHLSLNDNELTEGDGESDRVHFAGEGNATWLIGNVYIKVHAWRQGLESEATRINFVRANFPSIPVPEVIHTWIDEKLSRTFLAITRIEGQTLDDAWPTLSLSQRKDRVEDIVQVIVDLATKTSECVETSSGLGISEVFLMQDRLFSHPCWLPRLLPRFTAADFGDYMKSISTSPPPDVSPPFPFYHSDLSPTNVMVSLDGQHLTGIIDWESAAYLPRFWIPTLPQRSPAFRLGSGKTVTKESLGYREFLKAGLEKKGYVDESDVFKKWSTTTKPISESQAAILLLDACQWENGQFRETTITEEQ